MELKNPLKPFFVTLSSPQNAVLANNPADLTATITIIDDEKPTLRFDNHSVSINETDTDSNVDLIFKLNHPLADAITIPYVTISETATDVEDYTVLRVEQRRLRPIPLQQQSVFLSLVIPLMRAMKHLKFG